MANAFTTEDRTAFKDIMSGFEDALTISKNVNVYRTDSQSMERQSDIINRPVPYILTSQNRTLGSAVSAQDANELKVPCLLDEQKNVTWNLDAKEMRDQIRDGRLGYSAYQRLASDINSSVRDEVSLNGSLVVKHTAAASTYDQVAEAESLMLEQGVSSSERCIALTARDYNGMAGNLAGRQDLGASKALSAYDRSYIGMVAGFDALRIDAGKSITAAAGTSTIDTTGSQVQYAPAANTDNREQTVTVSSTTNVAVGDCFTIAGIEAVHHITKDSTGQLKTFRVTEIVNGTSMKISPPIIGANSTPTDAESQYKNVEVVSTSATAAITYLNTATAGANPFWCKEAIELLPGRYSIPTDQGVDILRGTTDNGIEVVMGKKFDNSTFVTTYTLDVFYGVELLNPEMAGIVLFNQ